MLIKSGRKGQRCFPESKVSAKRLTVGYRRIMFEMTSSPRRMQKLHLQIIFLVLVCIAVRIPRVEGIVGDDAFLLLTLGRIASQGNFQIWTVSPFSVFALYPFSSYPIGLPLIVGALLSLGFTYENIIALYSIAVVISCTTGAYASGAELGFGNEECLLYAAIFGFSGTLMGVTYFTIHPRGILLAVAPWFFLYGLRFLRQPSSKGFLKTCLLLVLMMFFHGLALYYSLFGLIGIIYLTDRVRLSRNPKDCNLPSAIFKRYPANGPGRKSTYYYWIPFLMLCLAAVLFSTWWKITYSAQSILDIIQVLQVIASTGSYAAFQIAIAMGFASFFVPIGILAEYQSSIGKPVSILHLLLVPSIIFSSLEAAYAIILFLPVLAYYSVKGINRILGNRVGERLLLLTFLIPSLYAILSVTVSNSPSIWLIPIAAFGFILWGTAVLIYGYKKGWRLSNFPAPRFQYMAIVFIVVFSLAFTEAVYSVPNAYMSNDDQSVVRYLLNDDTGGITFVYSFRTARRYEAYGILVSYSHNYDMSLYYGWISPSQIRENTVFSPMHLLSNGKLFDYEGIVPGEKMWYDLIGYNLLNSTERQYAINLGLKYIVVEVTSSGYSDMFDYGGNKMAYSPLLHSAPKAANLVFSTETRAVFQLNDSIPSP